MLGKSFHKDAYKDMIRVALDSGYKFILFEEKEQAASDKFCILRHDIDADLKAAYEIALIENEMGVRSTYFLMIRSPLYNLFGRANHAFVEKILSLGHAIGLHYDEGFYPNTGMSLPELVDMEAKILSTMFKYQIKAVSFHQPGINVRENKIKIHTLINTYDKQDMEGVFYLSDSNMIWKGETPEMIFKNSLHQKVQILIHPMWWVGKGIETTEMLWDKAILDNIHRSLDQVIETERAFGSIRGVEIKKPKS